MNLTKTRTGLIIALATIVTGGITLVTMRGRGDDGPSVGTDTELIRDVVNAAVEEEYTACLFDSYGNLDMHKQNMAQYFSSTAPSGDRLATRSARWKVDWATPSTGESTSIMENRVKAVNEGELPTTMLDTLLTPPAVTPDWSPEDSALISQQHGLDMCHSGRAEPRIGRRTGFDVEVIFDNITITGNTAVVSATLTGSKELFYPFSNYTQTVPIDWKAIYWMVRENDQWYIGGDDLYLPPGQGVG